MCSIKISVFKNFVQFTGKHLCQSLFFNKVAGLRLIQNFLTASYTKMTNVLTAHQFLLISFSKSIVTCNVLKIVWVANVNNFSVTLIPIANYVVRFYARLKNFFSSFSYWWKKMWWKCQSTSAFCFLYYFFVSNCYGKLLASLYPIPPNILTSDQRWFNVADQRWNKADPTLKMKQNPTSDFQRFITLIQRLCPTLKQPWYNIISSLSQLFFNISNLSYIKISRASDKYEFVNL